MPMSSLPYVQYSFDSELFMGFQHSKVVHQIFFRSGLWAKKG